MVTSRFIYLDTIRAILSVVVLLYHWGLHKLIVRIFPSLSGGAWGLAVDYFFLLSGFVLCLSLSKHRTSFFQFVLIRAFRLFPVAVTALAFSVIVNFFLSPPVYPSWTEVLANLFLVQTFVGEGSLPGTMWSASFEMWIPSLFCLLNFVRLFYTGSLIFLLACLLVFQGHIDSSLLLETSGWYAFARAVSGLFSGFFLGQLFLNLKDQAEDRFAIYYLWLGIICFACAIVSILVLPDFRLLGFVFPFFPCLSIYYLALAEYFDGCLFPTISHKIIFFFSSRSYAIYLIHMPIISISLKLFGPYLSGNVVLKLLIIIFTLLCCNCVYLHIENPAYRLRRYCILD